jgi:acetylornithine deacetylase/succinyl-diaminopimelate desuccinylase-like protein
LSPFSLVSLLFNRPAAYLIAQRVLSRPWGSLSRVRRPTIPAAEVSLRSRNPRVVLWFSQIFAFDRWRWPSLSIHKIDVSGPSHSTVIPSSVKATVSIRIVPDQSLDVIAQSLEDHVRTAFAELKSSNSISVRLKKERVGERKKERQSFHASVLQIRITHIADWWLGDPTSAYSQAFVESIKAEWGTDPLWIREGGSIPSIPFLEREFNAKAVHIPLGQSSDCSHLPNERIRILNLEVGLAFGTCMVSHAHG